jgi:phospholipid/cholesterol/gamma-HCH transport system permease protein
LFSQNNCSAIVSFFDRDKYVLGFWVAGWQVYMAVLPSAEFIDGAQRDFIPFHIAYAFIKTLIFAMLLATIPSFMATT